MLIPSTQYIRPEGIDYYALPLASNSSLFVDKESEFVISSGKEFPKEAAEFGRQFHERMLEYDKYKKALDENLPAYQFFKYRIEKMKDSLYSNGLFNQLLINHDLYFEKEFFPIDSESGNYVKLKADAVCKNSIFCLDLKTTACKTREEFEKAIIEYNYDRQAAWYIDGTGVRKYYVFAVQKNEPYDVFTFLFSAQQIADGRAKYEEGLRRKFRK